MFYSVLVIVCVPTLIVLGYFVLTAQFIVKLFYLTHHNTKINTEIHQ